MSKIPFNKISSTPAQLLTKLESRKLTVGNRDLALSYLQHVGGFRLKGYYYHLTDPVTKEFQPGTTFEQIAERYEFDRKLRALSFECITRLETSVRSSIANQLSLKHGPHWFLNHEIFQRTSDWDFGCILHKISSEVGRSGSQPFVKHYYNKFSEPFLPPSWAMTECVTFGMWSRTYSIIKDADTKKAISMKYKIKQHEVFSSWLHSISELRNTVAHHSRLLRHKLVNGPQNLKDANLKFTDCKTFYSCATAMNYLMVSTGLPQTWKNDLTKLFADYPSVDIADIGFPKNVDWKNAAGW